MIASIILSIYHAGVDSDVIRKNKRTNNLVKIVDVDQCSAYRLQPTDVTDAPYNGTGQHSAARSPNFKEILAAWTGRACGEE